MSTTKSQTEGMMSQAKGWLSGALKSMADKLDGNSAGVFRRRRKNRRLGSTRTTPRRPRRRRGEWDAPADEPLRRRRRSCRPRRRTRGENCGGVRGGVLRRRGLGRRVLRRESNRRRLGRVSDGETIERGREGRRVRAGDDRPRPGSRVRSRRRLRQLHQGTRQRFRRTGEHLEFLLGRRRRVRRARRTVRDVRFATFGSRRRGMTLDTRRRLTRVVPLARRVLERLLRRLTRVVPLAR